MAVIVSASYELENHTQVDGRRYVYETFIDNEGAVYYRSYLAEPNADYDAILIEHTAELDQQLAGGE